jgi:UDP-N-acetylglucosamine 1-carboxyvinyltransferase
MRVTSLLVRGGGALNGHICPSANKNAVLPILCATLLTEAPITLRNVPDITDVRRLVEIFRELGSKVEWDTDAKVMQLEHRQLNAGVTARPLPARHGGASGIDQGLHAGRARA